MTTFIDNMFKTSLSSSNNGLPTLDKSPHCFPQRHTVSLHNSDFIKGVTVSQITGVAIVCRTICWGADQRKQQSSVSLALVKKSPVTGEYPASNAENVFIWWRHHEFNQNFPTIGISCLSWRLDTNITHEFILTHRDWLSLISCYNFLWTLQFEFSI